VARSSGQTGVKQQAGKRESTMHTYHPAFSISIKHIHSELSYECIPNRVNVFEDEKSSYSFQVILAATTSCKPFVFVM
jgi:hypothetical protein